jgi:hypothetical protein
LILLQFLRKLQYMQKVKINLIKNLKDRLSI